MGEWLEIALALFPLPPSYLSAPSKAHCPQYSLLLPAAAALPLPYSTRSPLPSPRLLEQRERAERVRPSLHCPRSLAPSPTPGRAFKSAAAPSAERLSRCPGPSLHCSRRRSAGRLRSLRRVPGRPFTPAAVLPLWAFLYGPEQRLAAFGH
ncbi:hypothetical protein PVAP13_9KG065900 [Panicum virgatum]|uniref:Uncharacterized protein n=1 Tax=Panicum virgatum TaxID=38727 RepID=A0A8T0NCK7_PANVG|nr:hypothetical protein PVAP13_9KG065900 [Panicum virgatum]